MTYRILLVSAMCLLFLTAAIPGSASQFELESPPILKLYMEDMPTDDALFFEKVSEFMTSLSGQTVPTGSAQTEVQFFTLLSSAYNIEEHATAQLFINFLFYTAKAGEHFGQHVSNSQIRFTPIDVNAEYTLAEEYIDAAKEILADCEVCAEYYPDFVMCILPEKATKESDIEFTGKLTF